MRPNHEAHGSEPLSHVAFMAGTNGDQAERMLLSAGYCDCATCWARDTWGRASARRSGKSAAATGSRCHLQLGALEEEHLRERCGLRGRRCERSGALRLLCGSQAMLKGVYEARRVGATEGACAFVRRAVSGWSCPKWSFGADETSLGRPLCCEVRLAERGR